MSVRTYRNGWRATRRLVLLAWAVFAACPAPAVDIAIVSRLATRLPRWTVETSQERFGGRPLDVVRITSEDRAWRVKASALFGADDAIYLSFNQAGHLSLVDQSRFDGNSLFRLGHFNDRSDLLDSGIIVRIPMRDAGRGNMKAYLTLRRLLSAGSVTCVGAGFKVLERVYGIRTRGATVPLRPDRALEAIFAGLVDDAGEAVPVSVYLFNTDSVAGNLQRFRAISRQAVTASLVGLVGCGVGLAGLAIKLAQ